MILMILPISAHAESSQGTKTSEQAKKAVQEMKVEKKATESGVWQSQVQKLSDKMCKAWNKGLDETTKNQKKFDELAVRLDSFLTQRESQGKDVTESRKKLAEAKKLNAELVVLISNYEKKPCAVSVTGTTEKNVRQTYKDSLVRVEKDLKELHTKMKTVRKALAEVVREMGATTQKSREEGR